MRPRCARDAATSPVPQLHLPRWWTPAGTSTSNARTRSRMAVRRRCRPTADEVRAHVACRLDEPAAGLIYPRRRHGIVLVERRPPDPVTHRRGPFRSIHDVGEEDVPEREWRWRGCSNPSEPRNSKDGGPTWPCPLCANSRGSPRRSHVASAGDVLAEKAPSSTGTSGPWRNASPGWDRIVDRNGAHVDLELRCSISATILRGAGVALELARNRAASAEWGRAGRGPPIGTATAPSLAIKSMKESRNSRELRSITRVLGSTSRTCRRARGPGHGRGRWRRRATPSAQLQSSVDHGPLEPARPSRADVVGSLLQVP